MQVRNWIGTLNGIDASFDAEGYLRTMVERGLAKYAVGQLERGSESGRLHLQYFVQMERSRRLAHMRSVICDRSHWEPMYGSVAQARAYATKDDTRVEGPWEFGLMSSVGKRRGLEEAVDCVKAGMSLSKVAEEFSLAWVAHGRGLTSLRQQLKLDADRRSFGPEGPEVWVLWGPSGTRKSRFVAARWPDAFWKAPESKWWDGYSGQETVVLDDFKDYAMPLVELQRLLDWYPLWVEVKGGSDADDGQEVRPDLEHQPGRLVSQGGPTSHRPPPNLRLRRALRPPDRVPGRVGSFPPAWAGGRGWGNTRAQPRDPPWTRCPRRHRQLA